MPPPMSSGDVLSLVAEVELPRFAEALGIKLAEGKPRPQIKKALPGLSRNQVLRALNEVSRAYLSMLRDVVTFLESDAKDLRTTGFILALPGGLLPLRHKFGPQATGLLAEFDEESLGAEHASTWAEAKDIWWQQRIYYWIDRVIRDAKPSITERPHPSAAWRRRPGEDPSAYNIRDVQGEPSNLIKLFALRITLDDLLGKLEQTLVSVDDDSPAGEIDGVLRKASRQCKFAIEELRRDPDVWQEVTSLVPAFYIYPEDTEIGIFQEPRWPGDHGWDIWLKFIEDLLMIAEHRETPEPDDLLRLALLKDRPRLYEVWLMTRILDWYREWNCEVELLSLQPATRFWRKMPTWFLNYSRASTPVARITSGTAEWFLFYQLFQTGLKRANMPDLALCHTRDPRGPKIWIADPKYAEAGGYRKKNYTEVASRYKWDFNPREVWVCEYFDHAHKLQGSRELKVEQGATVLVDVQPDGSGLKRLEDRIKALHKSMTDGYHLAIDTSSQFRSRLESMRGPLLPLINGACALYAWGEHYHPIKDHRSNPARAWQSVLEISPTPSLKTDAFWEIERLARRELGGKALILVTDQDKDVFSSGLRDRLHEAFLRIHFVRDEASLAAVRADTDIEAAMASSPPAASQAS